MMVVRARTKQRGRQRQQREAASQHRRRPRAARALRRAPRRHTRARIVDACTTTACSATTWIATSGCCIAYASYGSLSPLMLLHDRRASAQRPQGCHAGLGMHTSAPLSLSFSFSLLSSLAAFLTSSFSSAVSSWRLPKWYVGLMEAACSAWGGEREARGASCSSRGRCSSSKKSMLIPRCRPTHATLQPPPHL